MAKCPTFTVEQNEQKDYECLKWSTFDETNNVSREKVLLVCIISKISNRRSVFLDCLIGI